jgi:hypothetical protein
LRVPAFCDSCGTIFPSSIEVVNSTNITFGGVGSGPCPRCGGMGHIPDGVYNFVGNTIELLSAPSRTITELERLAIILRETRELGDSPEVINNRIREEVPGLSSIVDILPRSRSEIITYIQIIIAIIGIILMQMKSNAPSKIEINQVFNNIYQQQIISEPISLQTGNLPKKPPSLVHQTKKKIGRNDPCHCGSGKKYKKCCLDKK